MTCLHDLPDHLLLRILAKCAEDHLYSLKDGRELKLINYMLVCKKWDNLLKQPSCVWQRLPKRLVKQCNKPALTQLALDWLRPRAAAVTKCTLLLKADANEKVPIKEMLEDPASYTYLPDCPLLYHADWHPEMLTMLQQYMTELSSSAIALARLPQEFTASRLTFLSLQAKPEDVSKVFAHPPSFPELRHLRIKIDAQVGQPLSNNVRVILPQGIAMLPKLSFLCLGRKNSTSEKFLTFTMAEPPVMHDAWPSIKHVRKKYHELVNVDWAGMGLVRHPPEYPFIIDNVQGEARHRDKRRRTM